MSYIIHPVKITQLSRYSNITGNDILLVVQSGSILYSKQTSISDVVEFFNKTSGSYSGSFTGSFKGEANGYFSGSLYGSVISKNTIATGNFSGSLQGSLISKNIEMSGAMSGSFYGTDGNITDLIATGSVSGSIRGKLTANNADLTGSIKQSNLFGSLKSKNAEISGALSGTKFSGSLIGRGCIATGSFNGYMYGSLVSRNAQITGSYEGAIYADYFSGTGSYDGQASLQGINNISDYNNTGIAVSYVGTASYCVSASIAEVAKESLGIYLNSTYKQISSPPTTGTITITKPYTYSVWEEIEFIFSCQIKKDDRTNSITVRWDSSTGDNVTGSYDTTPQIGCGNLNVVTITGGDNDDTANHWQHIQSVPESKKNDTSLTLYWSVAGGGNYNKSVSLIGRYY